MRLKLRPKNAFSLIRTLVLVILVLIIIFGVIGGFAVYKSKNRELAVKAASLFPYPAAYTSGRIVRYSDWNRKLSYLETMAAKSNQNISLADEGKKVLEEEIDMIIYEKEAKKLKITVPAKEVESTFESDVKDTASLPEIEKTLKEMYGMNLSEYKATLRDAILRQKVDNALLENGTLMRAKARHILIAATADADQKTQDEAKKKAENLIKEIKDGKSFEDMAKEYSEDKTTREQGGDVGEFTHGQLVAEFENAVFSAAGPGLIETPVKSNYGYHIIKVEEKKGTFASSEEWLKDQKSKIKIYRFI